MKKYKNFIKLKKLNQIFLVNSNYLYKISNFIIPIINSKIIEIGPGVGNLTFKLFVNYFLFSINIIVIELDKNFSFKLKKYNKNFIVFNFNILNVNFYNFIKNFKLIKVKFHIIGNLPYNISTLILLHLMNFINIIYDQFFMLQKELFDKILKKNNSLSIRLYSFYKIIKLINVKKKNFFPSPNVESVFIKMQPLYLFLLKLNDLKEFNKFLNIIFSKSNFFLKLILTNYIYIKNFIKLKLDIICKKKLSIDLYVKIFYLLKKKKYKF